MSKFTTFQRRAVTALKTNLGRTRQRLVEWHKNILKSGTLSPEQKKITKLGLEENERAVKMYKELLSKFGA